MLHLAKEWNLIREVPTIPLQEQRQRTEVFDPAIEQRISDAAKQPFRYIFVIMMDTGCRPSEVVSLRCEDMRFDQHLIFISKRKTKKSRRFVLMSNRVRDALQSRAELRGERGWIFPSRRGDSHYTVAAVDKEFRHIRVAVGLPLSFVPYIARHSFATSAVDLTGNIQLVADALGHSGIAITSTYLHPSHRGPTALISARNEQRTDLAMSHSAPQSNFADSSGTIFRFGSDATLRKSLFLGPLKIQT